LDDAALWICGNTGISGHSRAFPGFCGPFFAAATPAFPGIRRGKTPAFPGFPGFFLVVPAKAGTDADAEKACAALA